jgi:hypothetical protein
MYKEDMKMRRIVTIEQQVAGTNVGVDSYFDRIIKYIPADVVGAWVAITGLIAGSSGVPAGTLLWVLLVVMMAITMAWTLQQTALPGKPPAIAQAVLATGSFFVWVFALGGPFTALTFYRPLYGSLLLIVYTVAIGLFVPRGS